jgi:hypothetical protein
MATTNTMLKGKRRDGMLLETFRVQMDSTSRVNGANAILKKISTGTAEVAFPSGGNSKVKVSATDVPMRTAFRAYWPLFRRPVSISKKKAIKFT